MNDQKNFLIGHDLSELNDLVISSELIENFDLSEEVIFFTIKTSKGLVDFLAEIEMTDNGDTLQFDLL
jgi:hypothetical protein